MRLLDWFKKSTPGFSYNQLLDMFGAGSARSGIAVSTATALECSTVLACVRVIANGLSQVPFKLYRAEGRNRVPAVDHNLFDLVDMAPNDFQTAFEFRSMLAMHLCLNGNAFVWLNRIGDRIVELLPYPPGSVSITRDGWEATYRITIGFGFFRTGGTEIFAPRINKRNLSNDNGMIANLPLDLNQNQPNWFFGLCFLYLRNVQGYTCNHKRVYRIYCELELNLRIKPRKRIKRAVPEMLTVPKSCNQVWSMDFMRDQLQDGRCVRWFNVMDDFNREGLGMENDFSLPSERVIRVLEQIIEWRGCPSEIRCDSGTEYISSQF